MGFRGIAVVLLLTAVGWAQQSEVAAPATDAPVNVNPNATVTVLARPGFHGGSTTIADGALINSSMPQATDAMGQRWDFHSYGGINDGTNDCFDGGLNLYIDNQQFSPQRRQTTADKKEAVYAHDNLRGWAVVRRSMLDRERGAVRYIESVRNTQAKKRTVAISVRSTLGGTAQSILSDSGGQFLTFSKDDRGVLAVHQSSRPSVMFLINDPRQKMMPQVQVSSKRTFNVTWNVEVPAGETVSIFHVVAQRPVGTANAEEVFDGFYKRRLIDARIPESLRDTIVNFRVGGSVAGEPMLGVVDDRAADLGMERGAVDYVVIDENTVLSGKVGCESLKVTMPGGDTEVAWSDVAMLIGGADRDRPHLVHLRDGQILRGHVRCEGLKLDGDSGISVTLTVDQLDQIIAHTDPSDRTGPTEGDAMLAMTDGQRVAVSLDEQTLLSAVSLWGPVKTPITKVFALERLEAPRLGHMLYLDDGSQLSVVLAGLPVSPESARVKAAGYAPQKLQSLFRIARVPAPELDSDAEPPSIDQPVDKSFGVCELAGENVIVGTIDLPTVKLNTPAGEQAFEIATIKSIEAADIVGPHVHVVIELNTGAKANGRLAHRMLPIVSRDRKWSVPARHLVAYAAPEPPEEKPEEPVDPPDDPEPSPEKTSAADAPKIPTLAEPLSRP